MKRILQLDPSSYQKHFTHGQNRTWIETNCYVDLLIEQLHALKLEPIAAMAFTLGIDFEGDQWTFFKFPDGDIADLFGIDIQEMAVWRPLLEHIEDMMGLGRPVMIELDSFFLPDTAGTAYKWAHVKSTVGINELNVKSKTMGYFHNQGYYHMSGADFDQIFQTDGLVHERMLPPYIEYLKFSRPALEGQVLVDESLAQLRRQVKRLPARNPFESFKTRFQQDIEWLMSSDIAHFHTYSFANLRQYGACFELSQSYLQWLKDQGLAGVDGSIEQFGHIAQTAKAFQFQLARSMVRKKALDLSPIDRMGESWDLAMSQLKQSFL